MSESRRLPSIAPYDLPQQADLPASRADWLPDPARAALLVHDMQAYFVDAFTPDCAPIAPMIANLARLVAMCRAAGVPVFYTAQIGAQEPHDRGLQRHLWGPGMRHVPEHERIVAPLASAEGDIVLVKHRYSAFQRSNFAELLAARGRDQLLIGGVYAHIGCQCTAAEAFQRDIEPFFIADALADFSRDWHEASLANVADCLGVVLSTEQALASFQRDDDDA
ncbi:isochorismatase family protein [Aurantiacibacter flavus]|uniref:Isochorismatase family protein n=1 Tax=Aurantiacibacter flavus TaxID=3145232 RepID=A0ABV0CY87_9SPHN